MLAEVREMMLIQYIILYSLWRQLVFYAGSKPHILGYKKVVNFSWRPLHTNQLINLSLYNPSSPSSKIASQNRCGF